MYQNTPIQFTDLTLSDEEEGLVATSVMKEERHGEVVIRISVRSFINRMYCTLMLVFLVTVVGTVAFFAQSGVGSVEGVVRHRQVFGVVVPIYVLALILLTQFRDMFPSNILLIMLLTALSAYLGGYLTSYWQQRE